MEDRSSLLDKMNSERVNRLEEKVDRRLEGMENKIDRIESAFTGFATEITGMLKNKSNDNGFDWKAVAALAAFGALFFTVVTFSTTITNQRVGSVAKTASKGFDILSTQIENIKNNHGSELIRLRNFKVETQKKTGVLEEKINLLREQVFYRRKNNVN